MTMRIIHNIIVRVGKDSTMNTTYYDNEESAEDQTQVVIDKFTTGASNYVSLGAGQAIDLSFGSLTQICGLYMAFTGPCTVSVNNQQPFSLQPGDSSQANPVCKFFMEGIVTHLVITAPDNGPVEGDVVTWGYQNVNTVPGP